MATRSALYTSSARARLDVEADTESHLRRGGPACWMPCTSGCCESLSVAASFVMQAPQLRHLPGWRAHLEAVCQAQGGADELIFAIVSARRGGGEHGDLLDVLLAARNPDGSTMTDQQIRDNLMSMILAGHETTTAELAWAFQLLAHNPRRRVDCWRRSTVERESSTWRRRSTRRSATGRHFHFIFPAPSSSRSRSAAGPIAHRHACWGAPI